MRLWTSVFGYSEIALRMPSIIFSLITIYIVYLIVKKLKPAMALWASALVAFNPLLIYYAQEARMYAMAVMFITLAIYAKMRNKKRELYLWSFLAFCTYYGSIFILIPLEFWNWGVVGAGVVLLPLLLKQFATSHSLLGEVVNWNLTLGTVNLKNILLIFIKMVTGRVPFEKIYILPTLLFWLTAIKSGLKNKFFLRLLLVPLILVLIFSFKVPMLQYFRVQYLIIPLSILIALKFKNSILFLIILWIFSGMYLLNNKNYREDWKKMSRDLPNEVYMIGSFESPINYYRRDIKVKDIKQIKPSEEKFVYIPYGEIIHGLDHNKIFGEIGYKKIEEKSYREISFETWSL